jgi:hypothetical protein
LTDLLQVIEHNWEKFKHLEQVDSGKKVSKASIKVLIDFVNVGRVDAHAKPAERRRVNPLQRCGHLPIAVIDLRQYPAW